jgi:hypothetical protein
MPAPVGNAVLIRAVFTVLAIVSTASLGILFLSTGPQVKTEGKRAVELKIYVHSGVGLAFVISSVRKNDESDAF